MTLSLGERPDEFGAAARQAAQSSGACVIAAWPSGADALVANIDADEISRTITAVKPRIVYRTEETFDAGEYIDDELEKRLGSIGEEAPAERAPSSLEKLRRRWEGHRGKICRSVALL